MNWEVLEAAFSSGLADYEDVIQVACAVAQGLDAILTRYSQGFLNSSVPALSQECLHRLTEPSNE